MRVAERGISLSNVQSRKFNMTSSFVKRWTNARSEDYFAAEHQRMGKSRVLTYSKEGFGH